MARPSKYTEPLANKICLELSQGKSIAATCKHDSMPHPATVFRWIHNQDGFRDKYEKAKEEAAEHWAEELIEIADNTTGDTQRDRLRLDTRKWIASKLKPKKYGDKLQTDVSGSLTVVIKQLGEE